MTLKSGEYPWCVLDEQVDKKNQITFCCQRCKQKHSFNGKGIPVDRFLEISEAFCILHKECKDE